MYLKEFPCTAVVETKIWRFTYICMKNNIEVYMTFQNSPTIQFLNFVTLFCVKHSECTLQTRYLIKSELYHSFTMQSAEDNCSTLILKYYKPAFKGKVIIIGHYLIKHSVASENIILNG